MRMQLVTDESLSDGQRDEVVPLVCGELAFLPASQRQAVILRYLEGRDEVQSAAMAGCPQGTLGWRAAEGIARLRQRLTRHGIALGAMALTGALQAEASGVVPATLLASMASASQAGAAGALGLGAGQTTAAVSQNAVELADGTLRAMLWSKIQTAAVVCVLAGGVAAGGMAVVGSFDPSNASPESRIQRRTFPSVFQAWSPADNLKAEGELAVVARHDLVFHAPEFFGLRWDHTYAGLATRFKAESIPLGRQKRESLLRLNPNIILLAEIRYRDAPPRFLPEDHVFWKRDQAGQKVLGWPEGQFYVLDFQNPAYRECVAAQARAAVDSGVVDGVFLDWWIDDADRLALVKAVRAAIGQTPLILVNANDRRSPLTAQYVNGFHMECYQSKTEQDWRRMEDALQWGTRNAREPRIMCLETWYERSRQDLNRMRATTALSLTLSDGYCLFSDPNDLPAPDHLHDWYAFWNKSLGRPKAPGEKRADGSYLREFDNGTVIYNPMGNPRAPVRFEGPRRSLATGETRSDFVVDPLDGDIFLRL